MVSSLEGLTSMTLCLPSTLFQTIQGALYSESLGNRHHSPTKWEHSRHSGIWKRRSATRDCHVPIVLGCRLSKFEKFPWVRLRLFFDSNSLTANFNSCPLDICSGQLKASTLKENRLLAPVASVRPSMTRSETRRAASVSTPGNMTPKLPYVRM